MYLPRGVPGGCTWSWGVYLPGGCTWCTWSQGGVPAKGVYLVPGGVPGPKGVPGPGGRRECSCLGSVPAQGLRRAVPGPRNSPRGVPAQGGVYLVLGGCTPHIIYIYLFFWPGGY